ncbi:unnamed protein product [Penicillium glandicola]
MAKETAKDGSWYFAYGSNMRLSTFTGRGITPLAHVVVQADTHYLNFDVFGVPYGEPSFASIDEIPPDGTLNISFPSLATGGQPELPVTVPPVVGVAYLIPDADRHRLLVSEGSGIAYECIEVEVRKIAPEEGQEVEVITAWTLKAKHPLRPNGIPSARYMNLLLEGAEENYLPQFYVDYLRALPSYQKPEKPHSTWGQYIFDYGWRPFLRQVVRLKHFRVDEQGNCPEWIGRIIVFLYQSMWRYHDSLHTGLFGSGDGGKLVFHRT